MAEGAPDGDPAVSEPGPGREAIRIGWAVLTSPRTLLVLSAVLSALLLFGAVVEQGADREALLRAWPWSVARTLDGLGLERVLTAWPTLLVGLLLALNVAGLVLRHLALVPVARRADRVWTGPAVFRARLRLDRPADRVDRAAAEVVGGRTTVDEGVRVRRRGLWVEGLVLLGLGMAALALSGGVAEGGGWEARLEVHPDGRSEGDDDVTRRRVRRGELWLEQQLPWSLDCERADPRDRRRRRRCTLRGPEGRAETTLAAGESVRALGVTLRPERERLRVSDEAVRLTVRRPGADGPERLRTKPDRRYELPAGASGDGEGAGGVTLRAFPGENGPLVVANPPEGRRRLLLPALEREPTELSDGTRLAGLPDWVVDVRLESRPERYLVLAGVGLVVVGLLLLALVPHLGAAVRPAPDDPEGAAELHAWSFNRPGTPGDRLARLRRHLEAGDGAPDAEPAREAGAEASQPDEERET